MIKYRTTDGELVTGSSYKEVVEALRDGSFLGADETIEQFKEGFAQRLKTYSGHHVRTESDAVFIADLVAAGYWTKILD